MEYLTAVPEPSRVPVGQVIVHNNVRPAKRLGYRGFRAWLESPNERLIVCECGWAPGLDAHYRYNGFVRASK